MRELDEALEDVGEVKAGIAAPQMQGLFGIDVLPADLLSIAKHGVLD